MWLVPAGLPLLGIEPLHGAALASATSGVLVLGRSGTGKTTVAIELQRRGFGLLADDVCALDQAGRLVNGAPLQSVTDPGQGAETLGRYDGKWLVRAQRAHDGPATATHTVILAPARGARLGIEPLRGRAAFSAIAEHVRRPDLFTRRRQAGQLAAISGLAGTRRVARLRYDQAVHEPGTTADTLAAWMDCPAGSDEPSAVR